MFHFFQFFASNQSVSRICCTSYPFDWHNRSRCDNNLNQRCSRCSFEVTDTERHADQALANVTGKHVIHWTVGWWCCCCWIQNRFSQWKERHIWKNYSTQNATPVAANLLPDYVVGSSTAEYTDRDRQAVGDWMLRLNWGRVSSAIPEIILLQKEAERGPSIKHHLLCADIHHVQGFLVGGLLLHTHTNNGSRLANFPRENIRVASITMNFPPLNPFNGSRRIMMADWFCLGAAAPVIVVLLLLLTTCDYSPAISSSSSSSRIGNKNNRWKQTPHSEWQTECHLQWRNKQLNVNPLF